MPTQPKPWKPYWKLLETVLDDLIDRAPPSPIKGSIRDWIAELRFQDSCLVEFSIHYWISRGHPPDNFDGFTEAKMANAQWETILRFQCALDFVKGDWGKRKEFDFTQESGKVLNELLGTFWRESAFHWCARCLNDPAPRHRRHPSIPKPTSDSILN